MPSVAAVYGVITGTAANRTHRHDAVAAHVGGRIAGKALEFGGDPGRASLDGRDAVADRNRRLSDPAAVLDGGGLHGQNIAAVFVERDPGTAGR